MIIFLCITEFFDLPFHNRLPPWIIPCGLVHPLRSWLTHYLSNLWRGVHNQGTPFQPCPITSGVVRGSIPGLLLFILCTSCILNGTAWRDSSISRRHPVSQLVEAIVQNPRSGQYLWVIKLTGWLVQARFVAFLCIKGRFSNLKVSYHSGNLPYKWPSRTTDSASGRAQLGTLRLSQIPLAGDPWNSQSRWDYGLTFTLFCTLIVVLMLYNSQLRPQLQLFTVTCSIVLRTDHCAIGKLQRDFIGKHLYATSNLSNRWWGVLHLNRRWISYVHLNLIFLLELSTCKLTWSEISFCLKPSLLIHSKIGS